MIERIKVVAGRMFQRSSCKMSQDKSERMSEDMSERSSERTSEKGCQKEWSKICQECQIQEMIERSGGLLTCLMPSAYPIDMLTGGILT